MDRPAAGGAEIGAVGIGQIEGRYAVQNNAQAIARGCRNGRGGAGLGRQFRDEP
jgi:hypothetical protein